MKPAAKTEAQPQKTICGRNATGTCPFCERKWGGTPKFAGPPLPYSLPLLIVPKLLPPSQRALFRLGDGSIGGSVLRKRVCLQGMFPEVDRRRGGLPSQLRQLRPHTRPFEGVRDGSVLPVRRDAWRSGIGSQLLPCGNPPEKFLVAVHWFLPVSRR